MLQFVAHCSGSSAAAASSLDESYHPAPG
jgi:hypothetical protein